MAGLVQWLLVLCFACLASAQQQLPPWELPTFFFGWEPINNTFTRCGYIDLTWSARLNIGYTPVGPYTIIVYRAGQTVWRVNAGSGPSFQWVVNLNTGGPYLFGMDDANGATGGTSNSFFVFPGSMTCPDSGETAQTLSVRTLTSSTASCDTVSFEVEDGTPPYKLSFIRAPDPPKTVMFASPRFDHVLDVPAGVAAAFVVEDASGRSSVVQAFTVGFSSNSSCLTAASTILPAPPTTTYPGITSARTTGTQGTGTSTAPDPNDSAGASVTGSKKSKGPSIPAIIGGAVGGVALLSLLALLVLLYRRKKRAQPRQTASIDQSDDVVFNIQRDSRSFPSPSMASTSARTPSFLSEQQMQPGAGGVETSGEMRGYQNPASLQPYSQYQRPNEQQQPSTRNSWVLSSNAAQYANTANQTGPSASRSYGPPPGASKEEKNPSWVSGSTALGSPSSSTPEGQSPNYRLSALSSSSQSSKPSPPAHPAPLSYSPPPRSISPPLPRGAASPLFQPMALGKDPVHLPDQSSAPAYAFHPDMLTRFASPAISTSRSPPPQYSMK